MNTPIYYFAYGSNLFSPRLRQRVPSATFICQGQLLVYHLRFNKVGLDGSGKGNIEQTGCIDDCVWGAVFRVKASEVSHLDKAESLGVGYERLNLKVNTCQGILSVFTYLAILKDDELKPFHWYKAYIVYGAQEHRLPSSYIQKIKAVSSIPDPDSQRCQQNTLQSSMGKKLSPDQLELYKRIDEILFYKWDPIGISDSDWSRDEYQGYVPQIFQLALKNDSPKPIAEYLTWITTQEIGVGPGVSSDMEIAELIIAVKESCLE